MTEHTLTVLGDSCVGKSVFVTRFAVGHLNDDVGMDPTIEESYRKDVAIDDEPCTLNVIDTAGMEEYSTFLYGPIRTGQGFLVPIVLVANKVDVESERQVSRSEGEELAESIGAPYFETSGMRSINVDEPFFDVVRQIRKALENGTLPGDTWEQEKKKSKKACSVM